MVRLSVNVNKVATLRNSRGGTLPSVVEAVRVCVDAGAPGITVHPRADERHIRPGDVYDIAAELAGLGPLGSGLGIDAYLEGRIERERPRIAKLLREHAQRQKPPREDKE